MDFIHYAKWGIHVKEEPDSLDTIQLKEADDCNVAEINGGWMCKFPCDAQAAFNVSIADSIPSGLQEPIEASLPSYSVDYPESLGSHPPDVSTIPEESVHADSVTQLYSILQEDESAKKCDVLHENIEGNDFVKSPPRCQSLANIFAFGEIQQLTNSEDAVVLHDIPQREVISSSLGDIGENVVCPASDIRVNRSDEVSVISGSPGEVLQNLHSKLIDNSFSNVNSVENIENKGTSCASPEDLNHLQTGICTWTKSNVIKTNNEKNCLKGKSPKKSVDHSGFKCPDCDKVLRRSSGFLTHMKLHQMNIEYSEPDPVKCKHCSEVFQNRKSLSLHKKACKYSKKNSVSSFYNKDSQVSFSMRCSDEAAGENGILKTLLLDTRNESSSSRRDTQNEVESQLHQNLDINQKSSGKPRRSRSRGSNSSRKASSEERSEKSQSPKRRRWSQSFTDFCSENVGSQDMEKNSRTIKEKEPGVKNIDYQESWFSEIKREDEKRQTSKSIILSLRRFRFRRPKILVKRAEIPMCVEKESEMKSVDSRVEDTCSSNVSVTKSHNSLNEEHTSKDLTTELGAVSECNEESESNLEFTRDLNTLMLPVNHESFQENSHSVTCRKSLGREKYNLKPSTSDNVNKQPPSVADKEKNVLLLLTESPNVLYSPPASVASNSSLEKSVEKDSVVDALHDNENKNLPRVFTEPKTHSNLKIRIKPVVVLNRIGLLENVNSVSGTSAKGSSKRPFKKTQTSKMKFDQISTNVDSRESNKDNMQCFQDNLEILSSDLGRKEQTTFDYKLASHTQNLDRHCNLEIKNKDCGKNLRESFAKKLITCNSTSSLDKSKNKGQNDNEVLFETLGKRYCLKKCYVKLRRICIEDNDAEEDDKSVNGNPKIDSELRTCEKLKLHRTNSMSWEVSSVKPCHLKSVVSVDKTHVDFKDLTKENISKKKNCQTPEASSHILCESPGMSPKNHNLASKVRHLKPFRTQCTWCHKKFFNQQEFAEHVRTHFEGYKCHNCSAKFHFWIELKTHLAGCSLVSLLNCQNNIPIKECKVIL